MANNALWPVPWCDTCRCEDDAETRKQSRWRAAQLFETASELRVPQLLTPGSLAPRMRGFPTYSSAPDQALFGMPLREGSLWHLSTQERFESVNFSLYVNGFVFSTSDGLEASVSLSPFSLVRNCRFQSGAYAQLKSFKVSLLDHDPCCYFAVRSNLERESEEERSEWVLSISHTILLITDSLLPPFSVTCDPLPGRPSRRLMAGYLIHRDDLSSVSVLFCELQAHEGETAKFVMYENDLCESRVMHVSVTESTACCDIVGINCCCFFIDCHHFASQTPSERKLWLRALSNVKVKIQNRAPPPTDGELDHYREGIREHITAIKSMLEPRISSDALLVLGNRRQAQSESLDGFDGGSTATPVDDVANVLPTHVSL